MSMSKKEKRAKLWQENPKCYYCGVPTILPNQTGGKMLPNHATLEHLFSRCNPLRRSQPMPQERRIVLACYKCNNGKSVQDVYDFMSLSDVRLRSMGRQNWQGWAESWEKDLRRFEVF